MADFFYVVTILGAVAAGFLLAIAFFLPGAPQQAALAALAVGVAVTPYVIARSLDRIAGIDRDRQLLAAVKAQSPAPLPVRNDRPQ